MTRKQAYYKRIDLSNQKSISSKKLKDILTSRIRRNILALGDMPFESVVLSYYHGAHEILLLGRYNLNLYTDDEYDYIYDKIWTATQKRLKELRYDQI